MIGSLLYWVISSVLSNDKSYGRSQMEQAMNTLAKWTVDEYHRTIEAGILPDCRVELLSGEIHEITPEGPLHSFYGGSLADFCRDRLGSQALVREARPITLTDSEPEPDIAIVRGSWADYRLRHPAAEDIFCWLKSLSLA